MMIPVKSLILYVLVLTLVECDEEFYQVERSQWKDPHQFVLETNVDTEHVEKKPETSTVTCPEPQVSMETCPENNCADVNKEKRQLEVELRDCQQQNKGPNVKPYYIQMVRKLVEMFENKVSEENTYSVKVHLTADQLSVLQSLLTDSSTMKPSVLQDTNTILVNMIEDVEVYNSTDIVTIVTRMSDVVLRYTGLPLDLIVQLMIVCQAVFACIYFGVHIRLSWLKLCLHVIFILFIISIPWTWLHLYKTEVAKKMAESLKHSEVPAACRPGDMTWQHSLTTWFKDSFTFSEDECTKYHEVLMVDPFYEVPPTKAVAVAVSRFFLQPFVHIGETINMFFTASLQNLPVHIVPVVLIFIFSFITLLLLLMFGYSFSIPFLLSIKPTQAQPIEAHGLRNEMAGLVTDVERLRDETHQLVTELRHVKDTKSITDSVHMSDSPSKTCTPYFISVQPSEQIRESLCKQKDNVTRRTKHTESESEPSGPSKTCSELGGGEPAGHSERNIENVGNSHT